MSIPCPNPFFDPISASGRKTALFREYHDKWIRIEERRCFDADDQRQ